MPFYWDLGTTPLSPEEEFELEVSKENELTPSDWAARIAKLQGGKPIGATQIQSIK